jgi:hypothetical protein
VRTAQETPSTFGYKQPNTYCYIEWKSCSEIHTEHVKSALRGHNAESMNINPSNAELNPIRHLLALAGAHHFVDLSMIRVKHVTVKGLYTHRYNEWKHPLISLSLNQLSVLLIRQLHVGPLILNEDFILANTKTSLSVQL